MCSRVLKGIVLLAALGMAMAVGAVLGGGAVYLLTQDDNIRPVVTVRTGNLDSWRGFPPDLPHDVPMWGVMVLEVVEDSPASVAGLQKGDVIAAVGGDPVVSPHGLVDVLSGRDPGEEVELTVYRLASRVKRTIEVTLGEHPAREGKAYLGVWLGSDVFDFDGDSWRE